MCVRLRYHLLSPAVIAFRAIWPHQLCVQCAAFRLATNVFGRRAYFSRVFADPFCECQSGTPLTPPVVHSRHQCSGHPLPVVSTRHGHRFRCRLVPRVLARPCFTLCHRRVVFLVKCVLLFACACGTSQDRVSPSSGPPLATPSCPPASASRLVSCAKGRVAVALALTHQRGEIDCRTGHALTPPSGESARNFSIVRKYFWLCHTGVGSVSRQDRVHQFEPPSTGGDAAPLD